MIEREDQKMRFEKDDEHANFDFTFGRPRTALDNGRSLKIVQALPSDPQEFNEEIFIEFFDKLSLAPISEEALIHENCMALIDASRLILPKLSYSQIVNIFNQISRAEIPMFDEIAKVVVNALSDRYSEASVHDIVDIDFSVRRYYAKGPLSRLFAFLSKIVQSEFVYKVNKAIAQGPSSSQLMRIMRYLSNNLSVGALVDKSILSNQLLLIADHEFRLHDAVCVIVTYSTFTEFDEHSKQLISKMYRIWCNEANTDENARYILSLLSTKKSDHCDLSIFHNTPFIQHCAKLACNKNDIISAFIVLQRFNELVSFNQSMYIIQGESTRLLKYI